MVYRNCAMITYITNCTIKLRDARRVSTTQQDVHDQSELPVNNDTAWKQELWRATETAQCIANPLSIHSEGARTCGCLSRRFFTNVTNFLLHGNNLLVRSEIEIKQHNCYKKPPKYHSIMSIFRILNYELLKLQFTLSRTVNPLIFHSPRRK
jgi:hypothetical protein